jgi:hypothetical protein
MASILDIYLKVEVLETLLQVVKSKQEKGVAITVNINDETNQYGQNVSAHVSQKKEEREAKKAKYYVGNGKVVWTSGTIQKAEKKEEEVQQAKVISSNDLPF